MSTIKATGSATSNVLVQLSQSSPPVFLDRSTPTLKAVDAQLHSGDRPAVVVDLSDSSKALLERTRIAQAIADKLDRHMAAHNGGDHAQIPGSRSDDETAFSPAPSAPQAEHKTKWEAGSKWGDATISDAEFLERSMDFLLSNAESQNWAPEKLQAFRDAVAKGALKFHKASDVPGLNYHTTTTYSGGGMSNRSVRNPTGAVKEALENGDALAFWSADRGNVYVTW